MKVYASPTATKPVDRPMTSVAGVNSRMGCLSAFWIKRIPRNLPKEFARVLDSIIYERIMAALD